MKRLQNYLTQFNTPKILDVGTGRGNFIQIIKTLTDDFSEIVGIDVDDRILEFNKESFKDDVRIKFFKDDILETDRPEGSFDVVCLSNTVHHLANIEDTFKGMFKVLKSGGIIVINEMVADNLNPAQISHRLLHHFAAKVDREIGRYHDETFSKTDLIGLIKTLVDDKLIDSWDLDYGEPEIDHDFTAYENLIDRLVQMVSKSANLDSFLNEAEVIKEYIKNNGFQSATQVVMIIKK